MLLTGEPELVGSGCALLEEILRNNAEAAAQLYRTGAFFFALAYCGSNLLELACLLKVRAAPDSLPVWGSEVHPMP